MNINLTPQLENYVQQKIATGHYNNASEVMREALRLLIDRDQEREAKLLWLREAIQQGVNSGADKDWDGAEAIIKQAQARKANRQS